MGSWSKTSNRERHANAQTRERDKKTLKRLTFVTFWLFLFIFNFTVFGRDVFGNKRAG